jgi:hypothetical protein
MHLASPTGSAHPAVSSDTMKKSFSAACCGHKLRIRWLERMDESGDGSKGMPRRQHLADGAAPAES